MKKNLFSGLLTLPVLAALGVLLFLSLRTLERSAPAADTDEAAAPRYEMQDADWLRTGADGSAQFVARAEQISWYDDQSARLRHTELSALGGTGSPWRMSAPEGQLPAGSRDLMLTGPVLANGRWADGSRLDFHTDKLWIDLSQKQLHTDAEVVLDGAGRNVMATGLRANFDGTDIQLLSKVRAQYDDRPQPQQVEPAAPTAPTESSNAPPLS